MLGASNTWISSQVIERKGAEVLVTRDCLSNLEGFRSFLYSQIFLKPNMHSMILCTSWAIQLLPHHQDRHPSRQIWRLSSRKPGCETRPVCSQQNWGARCLQVLLGICILLFEIIYCVSWSSYNLPAQELLRQHDLLLLRLRPLVQLGPQAVLLWTSGNCWLHPPRSSPQMILSGKLSSQNHCLLAV